MDGQLLMIMRENCKKCGCLNGVASFTNGQDVVRCEDCDAYCYNAPRTETGKKRRSVSTTHAAIKPKQRSRIVDRANGACERCRQSGVPLHVGHVVSVLDGHKAGLTDQVINSDENLIAECEQCNLGAGSRVMPLRVYVAILMARTTQVKAVGSQ